LIVPKEAGSGGTLYYAVLSGTEWELKTQTLSSTPSDSKLVISSKHLNRLRSANLYVIVSTQSGGGLAATAFDNLLQPLLKQFDIPFSVHKTTSKTSHREFLKSLTFSPDQENVIIILGGDTVIYDLLNSMASNRNLSSSPRITICLVPCGTGNSLAMSLGTTSIPIGITRALGISETSPQPLPVLKVIIQEAEAERVIWGVNVCSWGLHASLVADSDDPEMRRQYGASRFVVFIFIIVCL
jgi:diacylglycerol kinase family enzyme